MGNICLNAGWLNRQLNLLSSQSTLTFMHKIYLDMLELSQDPNLNLYIGVCAGISICLFATAFSLNVREKLRARRSRLVENKIALENQYNSNHQEIKEVASVS
jgi:hypothetical protein